ncbi:MAG: hypothetical protein H0A75_07830 [Candidatus Methanofishera endochildressiae]|uniref:Uncharacterized protein n=1 Tax=Candidatus Methanofishera endochildressiae TaxID=2738884 RepID=A0A7Z0SE86_9GAMM|nr:hypothetical protein [Candidatus Methanofishera endochildressiae]
MESAWVITLLYKKTDAQAANISNYLTDVISGGFNFGFPINENQRFTIGLDVKHTTLKQIAPPQPLLDAENGDNFLNFPFAIGWVGTWVPIFPNRRKSATALRFSDHSG